MDDEDIGRIIGILVAGALALATIRWATPRWQGWVHQATSSATHIWHETWWILLAFAVLFIGLKVALKRMDRRAELRHEMLEVVAARISKVMPAAWDAKQHLKVTKWDGMSPAALRIRLVPACDTTSLEWRKAVIAASGINARPDWERVATKRWLDLVPVPVEVVSAKGVETGEVAVDAVESALAGLVPGVHVESGAGEGMVIGYAETTRDQSPQWRQRVVEQVNARTGSRWCATWDRQGRKVTLTSVPELPKVLGWTETVDRLALEDPRMVPYGIDEQGRAVCWWITTKGGRPHAIVVGETGSGKTETMKSIVNGFLDMGGWVLISDPKRQDFAEYLGRPGVLAVATNIADRAGMLVDVMAEVHRRNAGIAARKIVEDHPELAELADPAELAHVPLLVVMDELTQHTSDLTAWWASLTGEERAEWGGNPKSAKPTDLASYPAQVAQLARASDIHLLVGMQRGDASNFGDSTAMRDNLKHTITMGKTSAISSEMVWGDRLTGSTVEIASLGEGMSNGERVQGGHTTMGAPGRFKSLYVGSESRDPAFWERVESVAPQGDPLPLPHVSAAARSPQAALRELLELAGRGDTAGISGGALPAATAATVVVEDSPIVETDTAGITWESVPATDLQVGDVVSFGDVVSADVVEVEGWTTDEFTGDDVFRLVLNEDGRESCVDLSGDEAVVRRA